MAKKKKKRRSTLRQRATQTQQPWKARPSRREQIAQARKQKQRRLWQSVALVAVAAAVIVGVLIWLNNRPLTLTTVEARVPAGADGTAWGPADAPVVIEEWSNFG